MQLAVSIIAVISQVLVPRSRQEGRDRGVRDHADDTPAIENHIRKGETFKITSDIQTGKKRGMVLLDDHLLALVREGKIKAETAFEHAMDPGEIRLRLA